jgi:hypothetical protein
MQPMLISRVFRSGEVSKEDGIWKDDEGQEAKGVIGVDPGRFSWYVHVHETAPLFPPKVLGSITH